MAFTGFDVFMIAFTLVIAWAFAKYFKTGDLFTKGFIGTSLLVFLLMDFIMVASWFGIDVRLPF
jgi:hypothetical protein